MMSNLQDRIDRTVELYREIAQVWGAPEPVLQGIHFVDPMIFHRLPLDTIERLHEVTPDISFNFDHVAATIDAGDMFLRLYCGHNEACPYLKGSQ